MRNLNLHIRTVHEGKGKPCSYPGCGQTFSNSRTLKHHEKLHAELNAVDVMPQHKKKGGKKAMPTVSRKDKGLQKKPLAAVLSGADVEDRDVQRQMVGNKEFALNAKHIESELNENSQPTEDVDASDEDFAVLETAEVCRRKYMNEGRVRKEIVAKKEEH